MPLPLWLQRSLERRMPAALIRLYLEHGDTERGAEVTVTSLCFTFLCFDPTSPQTPHPLSLLGGGTAAGESDCAGERDAGGAQEQGGPPSAGPWRST